MRRLSEREIESLESYREINSSNYYKYLTDLIGIRVFFLYREDWRGFHEYITSQFENNPEIYVEDRLRDFDEDPNHWYIAERPKSYRRIGDSKDL